MKKRLLQLPQKASRIYLISLRQKLLLPSFRKKLFPSSRIAQRFFSRLALPPSRYLSPRLSLSFRNATLPRGKKRGEILDTKSLVACRWRKKNIKIECGHRELSHIFRTHHWYARNIFFGFLDTQHFRGYFLWENCSMFAFIMRLREVFFALLLLLLASNGWTCLNGLMKEAQKERRRPRMRFLPSPEL